MLKKSGIIYLDLIHSHTKTYLHVHVHTEYLHVPSHFLFGVVAMGHYPKQEKIDAYQAQTATMSVEDVQGVTFSHHYHSIPPFLQTSAHVTCTTLASSRSQTKHC